MIQFKDKSEWADTLSALNDQRKRTPWTMARVLLWGIAAYCTNRDEIVDLYDEMSEQLEINRKTLQNYASCARRFSEEQVRERLEIGHHIAVCAMPEEMADYWLDRAEANAWSVARMRQEIRSAAQTPAEEEDDPDSQRSIILQALAHYGINASGDDKSLQMGFPDGRYITVTSSSQLDMNIL